MELPATSCSACGFDFRLGRRPGPATTATPAPPGPQRPQGAGPQAASQVYLGEGASALKRRILIGAAAAAVAIAAILVLAFSGGEPGPAPEAAASGGGSSILAPSPAPLDGSPLLHPERPIGAAKRAAGAVNENRRQLEELADDQPEESPEGQ
ncbi:MAG: hypothetical protein LBG06_06240 [Deltaproteobacteria bacterium]|nr:hypothetical protein [Deltaproteobacteria bacterium]